MNINNKLIYIDPSLKPESRQINDEIQMIKSKATSSFKIYGMQFDTISQIDSSLALGLLSFTNLLSLSLPNIKETKETIKNLFRNRNQLKTIPEGSNIKFVYNDKAWLMDRRTGEFEQTTPDVYLNRIMKTKAKLYPGLNIIKVGDETFFTKEPVKLFDSNEWAFAVGGSNHVEIFSNGKRFLYNAKPMKLRFGTGGLFIVDENKRVQNVYYERYSEANYSKMRVNRAIQIVGNSFELVNCGRVMLLVQTDQLTYVRVSSVSPNIEGMAEINVDYGRHDVLDFGAFSENEGLVVVYFVYEFAGRAIYEEFKFSVK